MTATHTRLWNFFDGEPFLDNPSVMVLGNPKKRRKASRRRRAVRRSRPVKNFYPGLINPRKRHARRSARRSFRHNPPAVARRRAVRRGFRRNPPDILGFNLKDVALAGAAVVASPFLERQLIGLLPASLAAGRTGRWLVKVGSAAATGFVAKKVFGQKAGNLALIALGANLIADAVQE